MCKEIVGCTSSARYRSIENNLHLKLFRMNVKNCRFLFHRIDMA